MSFRWSPTLSPDQAAWHLSQGTGALIILAICAAHWACLQLPWAAISTPWNNRKYSIFCFDCWNRVLILKIRHFYIVQHCFWNTLNENHHPMGHTPRTWLPSPQCHCQCPLAACLSSVSAPPRVWGLCPVCLCPRSDCFCIPGVNPSSDPMSPTPQGWLLCTIWNIKKFSKNISKINLI